MRVPGALTAQTIGFVVTKYAALYHIDKTRKTEVPKKMLGPEYEGVVGSDSWGAWNHVGGRHQKCHALDVVFSSDTLHYHLTCPHLRLKTVLLQTCYEISLEICKLFGA